MSEWGECKHVAKGCLTPKGGSPTDQAITFGSDHSKLHTWKLSVCYERRHGCYEVEEPKFKLFCYPSFAIRVIDAVMSAPGSNRTQFEQASFHCKGWSPTDYPVKSHWNEVPISQYHPCDGEACSVEVTYLVQKCEPSDSWFKWEECSCPSAPNALPRQPLVTLSEDFRKLFQSRASADFIFDVGGQEIPAHKIVLSTRLTYFERLFASGTLLVQRDVKTLFLFYLTLPLLTSQVCEKLVKIAFRSMIWTPRLSSKFSTLSIVANFPQT